MALTVEKVAAALTLANGNVSEAARMLGVSRVTLYKWKKRIPTNQAA
jgi:transcriptional regulator of acetoin/glycerol metabolism